MKISYLIVLSLSSILLHCQQEGQTAKINTIPVESVPQFKSDLKKAKNILQDQTPQLNVKLGSSIRTEDCHQYLEPGGEVADPFPTLPLYADTTEAITISSFLATCGPEAFHISEQFLYIAYGFPTEVANAQDLRLAKYDLKTKELLWSFKVDRSENARNYIANYRGTFLTFVEPDKVCAGTLWAGGTQTLCINDKTKEKVWSGRIPSWSAIKPVGTKNGLFIAGLNSITKRYPFNGAEMEYLKLSGLGGRAAFYRTNKKSLFFSLSRSTDKPKLFRYDLEPLALKWQLELPGKVDANFGEIVNEVIVVHVKNLLIGISVDGKTLWQYDLGEGRPSITGEGKHLWVLHRRKSKPNILVKMNAKSGKRLGKFELEPGSLKVVNIGKDVFIKGVRAVRKIQ